MADEGKKLLTATGAAVLASSVAFMSGRAQLKAELITALGYDPTIVLLAAKPVAPTAVPDAGVKTITVQLLKAEATTQLVYTGEHDPPVVAKKKGKTK